MIHEALKMRVFDSNFSFTKYSKMRFFGSGPCGLPPYGVIGSMCLQLVKFSTLSWSRALLGLLHLHSTPPRRISCTSIFALDLSFQSKDSSTICQRLTTWSYLDVRPSWWTLYATYPSLPTRRPAVVLFERRPFEDDLKRDSVSQDDISIAQSHPRALNGEPLHWPRLPEESMRARRT